MKSYCRLAMAGAALALCVGCMSIPDGEARRASADALAQAAGWSRSLLASTPLPLVSYGPLAPSVARTLFVYLEGDGLAWLSRTTPSDDPTPRDPVGLKMALGHTGDVAVYLARACQYDRPNACAERYWTGARFAPEMIESADRAIDLLKARYGAQALVLVGYSGGGAVAALVAARRSDVAALVTVAGNLDTAAWTRMHGVAPLTGSLNPADFTAAIASLPQWHFVGGDDRVIAPSLVQGFVAQLDPARRPQVVVEPGFDHACCWADAWPRLLRQVSAQAGWPLP